MIFIFAENSIPHIHQAKDKTLKEEKLLEEVNVIWKEVNKNRHKTRITATRSMANKSILQIDFKIIYTIRYTPQFLKRFCL